MKKAIFLIIGALFLGLTSCSLAETKGEKISFSVLGESGLLSRTLRNVIPAEGCLASYDLTLPDFEKGVINESKIGGWCSGYETGPVPFTSFDQFKGRSYDDIHDKKFLNAFHCGYYLLLKLNDGRYLALLPLVSADVMAIISVYEGVPRIKLCTFGTDAFSGRAPLFSWAYAKDPYSATQKCWDHALKSKFCKDNIQWRSKKKYPQSFNYLGWCTWESFGGDITEANVIKSISEIGESPVPVRWVIIDDGYLDAKTPAKGGKSQLLSFGTNDKFPNGWQPITSLKDDAAVKWVGVWRNMSGYMGGVSPDHTMTEIKHNLILQRAYRKEGLSSPVEWEDAMVVKPDEASSKAFYEAMISNTRQSGFDFVKVDFQTYNFWMYAGTGNAVKSAHQNNKALEEACKVNNIDLLNCISQCNVNVFNTKYSVVTRGSVDIKLDNDNMARTVQSFANNMWWGDILIADLDMYHTGNDKTAQYLTVARAVSGGPVYISDKPGHFNKEMIQPVHFNDGKIIRTLAPAVPLPDSLFIDANKSRSCFRVIAPTRHGSCSIAAFNFSEHPQVDGIISKNDYPFAAAKEQPYNGLWSIPQEGLVVYDWQAQKGFRLNDDYAYSIDQMKGKIFNLSPINKGWAIIGRSDKYISGCTYSIDKCSKKEIEVTLDESGPLVIYHGGQKIKTSEGSVVVIGEGFYRIDLPIGQMNKKIAISLL